MAFVLYELDSGRRLGELSDAQRDDFLDLLEPESEDDRNRFVDREVVAFLEAEGADVDLVRMLREAVGEGEGLEVECREA
jgi:hypothetical protein